jgi:hypothetical protein
MKPNKLRLIQPGSDRANELVQLIRDINSREDTIAMLKANAQQSVCKWITEVILQGNDLNKAKAIIPHGDWTLWIKANCPLISHQTANRYMLVARNSSRVSNSGVGSLRDAVLLCSETPEAVGLDDGVKKESPHYLEAIERFGRLTVYIDRFPLTTWPTEGVGVFKEKLEPIARQLWPERFE